jgi:uncharacterized membrane protein
MSSPPDIQNSAVVGSKSSRLFALDALRGLIIVTMALDHANHFIAHQHSPGEYWTGGFPVFYNPLAFLTRFVTHPVAPGFSFLLGVGMYLFAQSRMKRGWSKWAITQHFFIRGAFLIALQLLVVNRAWQAGPGGFPDVYIGVLVALGGGMIIGSLLLWLQPQILIVLGIVLFVGTEFLHPDPILQNKMEGEVYELLLLRPGGTSSLWSNYPILPWLETVVFGLVFGSWVAKDPKMAFKRALQLGVVFLLTFVALRAFDGFGNIRPRFGNTWMDLLGVVKYPPAMTFTLLTMGINLIVLWAFAQVGERLVRYLQPLIVFGKVPMFFYILHLFLFLGLGRWLTPEGTSIPAMYPYWILGLLLLFPLCLWFGNFKHRQSTKSVLRFL